MAIAGALVTAPQAAHAATAGAKPATTATHQSASATRATLDSTTTRTAAGTDAAAEMAASTAQRSAATLRAAAKQHTVAKVLTHNTYYKVRSGDTLAKIAGDFYHKASDWQWLYHVNDKRISDPNVIYPGQSLFVPVDPPANYSLPNYNPRHSKPAASSDASVVVTQPASTSSSSASTRSSAGSGSTSLSGTLGCSGLERLWEDAGGNPADAVIAASIAMAESGGNQYALSPTDDYGYWQINASNGPLATFNPYGNARAAITLSDNGTNWSPWTTYTSGAYAGRC
ncbi:MAG TPA: LysM peptidoglycan-binding domain-containing protein [Trebonia sp.]